MRYITSREYEQIFHHNKKQEIRSNIYLGVTIALMSGGILAIIGLFININFVAAQKFEMYIQAGIYIILLILLCWVLYNASVGYARQIIPLDKFRVI